MFIHNNSMRLGETLKKNKNVLRKTVGSALLGVYMLLPSCSQQLIIEDPKDSQDVAFTLEDQIKTYAMGHSGHQRYDSIHPDGTRISNKYLDQKEIVMFEAKESFLTQKHIEGLETLLPKDGTRYILDVYGKEGMFAGESKYLGMESREGEVKKVDEINNAELFYDSVTKKIVLDLYHVKEEYTGELAELTRELYKVDARMLVNGKYDLHFGNELVEKLKKLKKTHGIEVNTDEKVGVLDLDSICKNRGRIYDGGHSLYPKDPKNLDVCR